MKQWPTLAHKDVIFSHLGYVPHPEQWAIHKSKARVILVLGGERAGKSQVAGNEVTARILTSDRVAFVGQEFTQARKEWTYTADNLTALGMMGHSSVPRYGQWYGRSIAGCEFLTISVNKGIQQLTGTGEPFDVVVICEAGLHSYNTFLAARGRVAETRGVVILVGTLWDNVGWYADMFRMGQGPNALGVESFSLPSWSNRFLFPGGKDDPEIKAWRASIGDDDEAARRIDAMVIPNKARMYPQFTQPTHVVEWARFDPDADVYLWVDPGYYPSRYAVIPVQFRQDSYGREVVCQIDEIWEHHKEHEDIIDMARSRPWWDNVIQAVGGHETKQHQASKSTAEVWEEVSGLYFETYNAGLILDGARRVRQFLKPDPKLGARYYLSPLCTGTASEFEKYSRKKDRAGNVVSDQPMDQDNDAMDAIRNGIVWKYGHVERTREKAKSIEMVNPYG